VRQLTIDLPRRVSLGRADFYVSDSNQAAVGWIERWPDWPSPVLLLSGPPGSGKTHLSHLWRQRAAAVLVTGGRLEEAALPRLLGDGPPRVAVDDADAAPERALLHLYNSCVERGGSLLIAARHAPGSWPAALPDLRSRLRAAAWAAIGAPDDALLAAVLVKHFADRQLRVAPAVIAYLVAHGERSFAAAAAIADRLDRMALSAGRPVTLASARRLLGQSSSSDFGTT
jgi:chromosomal replication initiation ATPase DnaA